MARHSSTGLQALSQLFLRSGAGLSIAMALGVATAAAQPLSKEDEAKLKQRLLQQQQQKQQQQPQRPPVTQGQPAPRALPSAPPPQAQRPAPPQQFQRPPAPPVQAAPQVAPRVAPAPVPTQQARPPLQRTQPPGTFGGPAGPGSAGGQTIARPPQPGPQVQPRVPSAGTPPQAPTQGAPGQFLPKRPIARPAPSAPTPASGAPASTTPPAAIVRPGTPAGLPATTPGAPAAPRIGSPPVSPPVVAPGIPAAGRIATPPAVAPVAPIRLDEVKKSRVERVDSGGRKFIEEPGNRVLIRQDNRLIIHKNEAATIQRFQPNARTVALPGGLSQSTYTRKDGVRVISEVDGGGRLVRRYGEGPGGRRIVYIDNRRFYRNAAIGVGIAAVGVGVALALAPPAIAMPRERYIVEYDRASDDDIYEVLTAPPVERLERVYSLDEIRYSHPLRERMRRVDLDTVTFELASFEIDQNQYGKLERMARAMGRAIEQNPAEVFLIEGHTDALGTPEDNLTLSDRRAEAVANVLIEHYAIPIENLVTQGYGEQFLKVPTDGGERANRRVAVRRITPMLSQDGGEVR